MDWGRQQRLSLPLFALSPSSELNSWTALRAASEKGGKQTRWAIIASAIWLSFAIIPESGQVYVQPCDPGAVAGRIVKAEGAGCGCCPHCLEPFSPLRFKHPSKHGLALFCCWKMIIETQISCVHCEETWNDIQIPSRRSYCFQSPSKGAVRAAAAAWDCLLQQCLLRAL